MFNSSPVSATNTVDISITPNIIFQSVSYDRPPHFLDMDANETKFTPFVTIGKYHDVIEWIQIAKEDFYAAQLLNQAVRKPFEIICYHCAQAVEKYFKGYLTYNEINPEKTHNLLLLLDI